MTKYRKKPVVIEAVQYTGQPDDEMGFTRCGCDAGKGLECSDCGYPLIETLEGDHRVSLGDFIITGVKGERYPCKPDIFAATYEPAAPAAEEPASPAPMEERDGAGALLDEYDQALAERSAAGEAWDFCTTDDAIADYDQATQRVTKAREALRTALASSRPAQEPPHPFTPARIAILRGEFVIARRVGTPSRGPYLTDADFDIVDRALGVLGRITQEVDEPQQVKQAVEVGVHGFCPGHPMRRDDPAATCPVCNMSRSKLNEIIGLYVAAREAATLPSHPVGGEPR